MKAYADPMANAEVQRLRAENERLLTELDRYDGEAWDSLRAKVARVEALADDMWHWCSPYGIATTYSQRITEALADPEEDQ